uniref:hypothetical protein n=1 Tax=Capnocytophaga cynodegmi TaxID=28189 RepID=UPI001BB42AF5|nr:hypothetical protein [Capnocytophaga cynodegmi]
MEGNHNDNISYAEGSIVGTALILEGNHNYWHSLPFSELVGTALILEGNHNTTLFHELGLGLELLSYWRVITTFFRMSR